MGVAARLRNAWKSLFGDGGAPQSAGGLLAGIFPSGQIPRRGTRELLQAYSRLPWLRTVTHRIAYDVASVPWKLYRAPRYGTAKAIRAAYGAGRTKLLEAARNEGKLDELEAHPMLDLLAAMNPALRGMASRLISQVYLDLKGETFWVLERNGSGEPIEAWPVPPHWIVETPSKYRPWFRAQYLGWYRNFPEEDVVWLRSPDPENPYGRGTGIGEALSDELDIDEFASKHVRAWFYNRALPDAIVTVKDIGEDERKKFEQMLEDRHRGVLRAHRPYIANTDIDVKVLAQTFRDQQLGDLRGWQRDTVIQVFNVPPECLGIIENSNRATIDAAYFLYAIGVLCPRMDFLVSCLQPLADYWDAGLVLGYASPVPDDKDFKQRVMASVPSVFTIDEHRGLAGAPPLPNGEGEELYKPAPALGLGELPDDEQPGPDEPDEDPEDDDEEEDDEDKAARPRAKATEADVERLLEELRPDRLTKELDPVWEAKLRAWGNRVLRELGVSASFDMRNPLIRRHLEHFAGTKIRGLVHETTRRELREALGAGVSAGEGIGELRKRVTEVFDAADKVRAVRIARTEVVGSSNFANVEAFAQSGVVAGKEWLAVRDTETRDSHEQLDGQVVKLRDAFVAPNGHSAQHPGGFGIAEEDIQCRCSALPVVELEGKAHKALTEAEKVSVWKRFDARAALWEKAATRALRRGFRRQEQDILEALDRALA